MCVHILFMSSLFISFSLYISSLPQIVCTLRRVFSATLWYLTLTGSDSIWTGLVTIKVSHCWHQVGDRVHLIKRFSNCLPGNWLDLSHASFKILWALPTAKRHRNVWVSHVLSKSISLSAVAHLSSVLWWPGWPRGDLVEWWSQVLQGRGRSVHVPNKAIDIVIRGTEDTREKCVALFHQFYSILLATIHESSPGTMFSTSMLSSTNLRAHHHHPHHYSFMEVFLCREWNPFF